MALVYIRPDADTTDGNWVNASASNTDLFDSVNESVASDADYIRSGNNPANDIVKLRLSNFGTTVVEPMTVRYRFKKVVSAGETLSFTARLVEGNAPGTVIAEWQHEDITTSYVDGEQLLTTAQFDSITDFDDLYLEFEAISGVFTEPFYAYGLLVGEDEGFAIDATVYDVGEEAYVGGPKGGTVAVKGDGANNLGNVALDASNLVQAGTSAKMVHFPTSPYVRWTPHNYRSRSQEMDNNVTWSSVGLSSISADSTTAPDGTSTADTLTEDSGNSRHIRYSLTADTVAGIGNVVTASIFLKRKDRQWGTVQLGESGFHAVVVDLDTGNITDTNGSGGTAAVETIGDGWYRISLTRTTAGGDLYFWCGLSNSATPTWSSGAPSYTGDGSSGVYVWGAQLNRGPIATPYLATTSDARIGIPLGYDNAEGQYGILVEPAATNTCVWSENLDVTASGWSHTNIGVTADATTAPDGSTSAEKIYEGSSLGSVAHQIVSVSCVVNNGGQNTYSIYAKAAELEWIALFPEGETAHAYFHLSGAGSVGSVGANNDRAAITSVGNGWYRCEVEFTATGTSRNLIVSLATGDNVYTYDAGSGGNGVYLWGAQAETGTVATSYIPTLGSTVTRAADLITALTSTYPHSATKGTIYASGKTRDNADNRVFWSVNDTTLNERINFYRQTGVANALLGTVDGGAEQSADCNVSSAFTTGVLLEATCCWEANDFDISVDGGTVDSDTSGTIPTVTRMELGGVTGLSMLNGWLYRLVYVPRQVETEGP